MDFIKNTGPLSCVGFRKLSHLTRDLSQAKKKIEAEQMHKIISVSLKMVQVVILSVAQLEIIEC